LSSLAERAVDRVVVLVVVLADIEPQLGFL
jgi:hypothetical protein